MVNMIGKRTRTFFNVVCVPLLLTISVSAEDSGEHKPKAPAFTARDIKNKLVFSDSLLAHGPLIIDFWATWCKPCIEEFKALKKIVKKYASQNLRVLAVNEDGPSEITKVKRMVAMKRWPFIVVMDNGKAIMQKYNVVALPSLFLVGSDGTIHLVTRGYVPGDEVKLEEKIRELFSTKEQN